MERSTCTLFFLSAFCWSCHVTCPILKFFIYIHFVPHFFCSLPCELHEAWFPVHPSISHSARHIVTAQNPTVMLTLTEHLLWVRHPSKHFTLIISFNPHRDSLLTLGSEGGGWLFPFSILQLHCLPFKCVFFARSTTELLFIYSWLFACLLYMFIFI